jgi:hypothetical protein
MIDDDDYLEEDEISSAMDTAELMDEGKFNDYPKNLPILPLTKRAFPPSLTG